MQINRSPRYRNNLFQILDYIAQDKKSAANKFLKELKKKIINLKHFPYKYRKSFYFDDENIRDLIFKGYTIIYKIEKDKIIILDIFKKEQYENLWFALKTKG